MNYSLSEERSASAVFAEGDGAYSYEYFGARLAEKNGEKGAVFRVWAPNAQNVAVVGSFNDWNKTENFMNRNRDGVWELFIAGVGLFIAGVGQGDTYKYCIETPWFEKIMKSDPFAFFAEERPDNASKVYDLGRYEWGDGEWIERRKTADSLSLPMNIYEIHAGSWKRKPDGSFYTYRMLADDPRSVHAADGAPVRPELGLPDDGLLCGDLALRHARGSDVPHRHPPPPQHRRYHGLGALEFPEGQLRALEV